MRIVSEHCEYEIFSLVQAVKKDRRSWENWQALCIETPIQCAQRQRGALQSGIRRLLDIYFRDANGTAFICGFRAIHIFCKGMPTAVLKTMGDQVNELAIQETGQASSFTIFDMLHDYEQLTAVYNNRTLVGDAGEERLFQASYHSLRNPDESLARLHDRKVLLVEDDPVTRWMVRVALKNQCLLATAESAGKAIATYKTYKPDMVLLDINLPGKTGRDIMGWIRQCDPGAYIVMFSGQDTLENIVGTMEDGARGFIAKPFSRENILHYVRECSAVR